MGNKGTSVAKEISVEETKLLVECTHFDEESIKNFYNSFIQDCPNGRLNKKDFTRMFKLLQPALQDYSKADRYSEYVFNAFDSDNSGYISFNEFVLSLSIASFGNLTEKIQLAFKIFDLDKNGKIERNEILKVIESLYDLSGIRDGDRVGENSPSNRVNIIMEKLDLNKDNSLSIDEFISGCMTDESVRNILLNPLFHC